MNPRLPVPQGRPVYSYRGGSVISSARATCCSGNNLTAR